MKTKLRYHKILEPEQVLTNDPLSDDDSHNVTQKGYVDGLNEYSLEFRLFKPYYDTGLRKYYEYELTLSKDGEHIDTWNSLDEMANGVQYFDLKETKQHIIDIAQEVNNGNVWDYFEENGNKQCPKCYSSTSICPECMTVYQMGSVSNCTCTPDITPIDCTGCEMIVDVDLKGVHFEGDSIPFIK